MIFSENRYFGYILKGDLWGAMDYLERFPEQAELLARYMSVFRDRQYIDYPVDREMNCVLRIYQQYYRNTFFLKMKKEDAENNLREQLADFFGIRATVELSDIEERYIVKLFKSKGFYFMGGKSSGYWGPYVWNAEKTIAYNVELPKETRAYQVKLLDGFITRSWIDYLSFGKIGTGGWTDGDGIINCIGSSYELNGEAFIVSLLKHEAQHAADLERYRNAAAEDLEYRAKLVELMYSRERNLLEQFFFEADSANGNNGHALASGKIIQEFTKKLNRSHFVPADLSIIQIQSIAGELYEESECFMKSKYALCK